MPSASRLQLSLALWPFGERPLPAAKPTFAQSGSDRLIKKFLRRLRTLWTG